MNYLGRLLLYSIPIITFLILFKKVYVRIFYESEIIIEIELFPIVFVLSKLRDKDIKSSVFRLIRLRKKITKSPALIKAYRFILSRSKPVSASDNDSIIYFFNSSVRLYNIIFAFFLYTFHLIKRKV